MDQPDFSKYSEQELRQIRRNIDAERFPERVAEIEGRLAALAAAPPLTEQAPEQTALPVTIAPISRRCTAFFIDCCILILIGWAAGACMFDLLSALGPWGRPLGFAIATAYFGVTQSRSGGQSPGMKILGIKVIAASGASLGMGSSIIRAAIFCFTYFLSGFIASITVWDGWLASCIYTLLFGVSFFSFYLLFFNRVSRQSLHDLAVGAFVVTATHGPLELPQARIWRGHFAIGAAGVAALSVAGLLMASNNQFADMNRVRIAVGALPEVRTAAVSIQYGAVNGMRVSAVIGTVSPDREALARRIAKIALERYPAAARLRTLTVSFAYGYDIGIAQFWRSVDYTYPPLGWRDGK